MRVVLGTVLIASAVFAFVTWWLASAAAQERRGFGWLRSPGAGNSDQQSLADGLHRFWPVLPLLLLAGVLVLAFSG